MRMTWRTEGGNKSEEKEEDFFCRAFLVALRSKLKSDKQMYSLTDCHTDKMLLTFP